MKKAPAALDSGSIFEETLIKSARADSEKFFTG